MYEFLYKIVSFFPLQLLAAVLLFAMYLKKRKFWSLKLLALSAIYLVGSYFIPWDLFVVFEWVSFKYIILLAAVIGIISLTFDVSYKEILFCATAGYAVEHRAFIFYRLLPCMRFRGFSSLGA